MQLGNLSVIKESNTLRIIFYVCAYLFYFPFAVQWASKASGLHPLTQAEARAKEKREKEVYRALNQKMNNNERGLPSAGVGERRVK
jgi:hypothetical protein